MNIKDINFAIEMLSHPQGGDESDINMALGIALKSLKVQRDVLEQELVLDKIREEIMQITDTMRVSYNPYVSKIDVLKIIDKYRK